VACSRVKFNFYFIYYGDRGSTVVKVLCYKSEGRWFDSRWCHWNFSLISFRSHYGPEVDSASNRNEYQEYFLWVKSSCCIRLTTLPPSWATVTQSGNLKFLEPSGHLGPVIRLIYFTLFIPRNFLPHDRSLSNIAGNTQLRIRRGIQLFKPQFSLASWSPLN